MNNIKENFHPFKLVLEEKAKVIRSLRGKYKNCFSSTEEFSQQKQAEIDWKKRN